MVFNGIATNHIIWQQGTVCVKMRINFNISNIDYFKVNLDILKVEECNIDDLDK